MSIAVTGATGQLGRLVIESLIERQVAPEEIVAVVRNADKAQDLAERGIRIAVAAYEDAVDHEADCAFAGSTVDGPVDVNERVGADAATMFSATGSEGTTVRIITRVADAVVTFSLSGQVDTTLDPVEAAAFGVGKQTLEGGRPAASQGTFLSSSLCHCVCLGWWHATSQ